MAKRRSMNKSQNHDGASNRKRFETCDNHWSDLNHDVLLLVIMQLGFVDFLGFSGVCKSWRSLAVSNKKKFLESRPPMVMRIKNRPNKNECYLHDFEGRRFKSLFPRSDGRHCIGLTCGYVVMFGYKTHDFWLVNSVTSHELYFPAIYGFDDACFMVQKARAVLVFSPSSSIFGWVLVIIITLSNKICFSIEGTGAWWNYVFSDFPILDVHAFKGKIYTLHSDWRLCEMTLHPDPKLTLLEIKDFSKPHYFQPKFVSAGENLCVVDRIPGDRHRVHRVLDFGEMKWVLPEEKTIGEYTFFLSILWNGVAVIGAAFELESWPAVPESIYLACYPHTPDKNQKGGFFTAGDVWYFLHECMSVNHIHE